VRADRGRFLLVLLFAVLAMAGVTTSPAAEGAPGLNPAAASPATHHNLRDWLPAAGRHHLSTPLPDSWCAVCAHTPGASTPPGRSLAADDASPAVATAEIVAPPTRAPPSA
jgi:hypothetical protein